MRTSYYFSRKNGRASPLTTFASKSGKGFTLIELLVVTAIIVAISAVVLANQNRFGGQVLLQNFVYDVALSIRQAQVYGLAVVRTGSGPDSTYSSYGAHFDISTPARYYIFPDINGNGLQDSGSEVDIAQVMNIKRGYVISALCISFQGVSDLCNDKKVDIIFQRPEPDAKISWTDGNNGVHGCFNSNPQCADAATITLKSPRGDFMSVTVDSNGQIAVDQRVGTE